MEMFFSSGEFLADFMPTDRKPKYKHLNKFKKKLLVNNNLQQEVEALKNPKIQA
jgi:hypothetical protein